MQKDSTKGHSSAHNRFLCPLWTIPPNFFLMDCDEGLTEILLIKYPLHAYGLELKKMFSIKTSSTSFSFEVFCLGTFWASSWGPWFWLDFVLGRWLCKIIVQVESIYKVKKQFFHLWVLHFQELAQKPYTFFPTTHNTQTYQEKDLKKNTNNKISL